MKYVISIQIKAPDDGFNAKIIKQVSKVISKPLTHIFNLTFTTGIIPEQIKMSLVTPIYI
jgi:hypothetical protein